MPDIVVHLVAAALYLALAWHFWNTRWRPKGRLARAEAAAGMRPWERTAILVPLAVHGWLIYAGIFEIEPLRFGFAQALSAMSFLAVALVWVESFFYRLDGMEPLVLPFAAVTVPLPALFPGLASSALYSQTIGFKLHLSLAMVAYGLFVIALLHATLMTLAERQLHLKTGFAALRLPPLLTLEKLLFRVIGAAFVFLTLTLLTGIGFSETLFGRALRSDHKTVFAILSWATFGLLLAGRARYGWRGRTALRWTLGGFVLLVLAYVGSRFVLEVVLRRP
ncbi:MAG: cytochrome c biogenesis protein CcsA [Betaproteobacteria bacterium]|nr:cytochrome c biogenesis protein CcsA [Betaproteobacteria bacterium]